MKFDLNGIMDGTDDRAVSPVIGVILMVAITVILAAVIGTFVLDIGQDAGQTAPQASLSASISTTTENVTLDHQGGDALQATETRILVEDVSGTTTAEWTVGTTSGTFTVGETAELNVSSGVATGFGVTDPSGPPGINVQPGNQYEVTIIDTNSGRIIFETTLTG